MPKHLLLLVILLVGYLTGAEALNVNYYEGKLVFTAIRNGYWNLFMSEADGTDQRPLTTNTDPRIVYWSPQWSPDGQQIAFSMGSNETSYNIYIINADGSGQRALTNGNGRSFNPTWSADGKQIAYDYVNDAEPNTAITIYVMNSDGKNAYPLITDGSSSASPSWSPDGKRIAYTKRVESAWQLYTMDANGSNEQQLTDDKMHNHLYPSWSPDSRYIAYTYRAVDTTDKSVLHIIEADGSDPIEVSETYGYPAAWSPDGKYLAFAKIDRLKPAIFITDTAGNNAQRIIYDDNNAEPNAGVTWVSWSGVKAKGTVQPGSTATPDHTEKKEKIAFTATRRATQFQKLFVMDLEQLEPVSIEDEYVTSPVWSHDGKQIIYIGNDKHETYIINSDGSNKQLLFAPLNNLIYSSLAWSPDGKTIAFSARTTGAEHIFVIDSDGENMRQLTTSNDNSYPSWSPDSKRIVYKSFQSGKGHLLMVMDADGSNQQLLLHSQDLFIDAPSWSPDGVRIAFSGGPAFAATKTPSAGSVIITDYGIYITDIHGSAPVQVLTGLYISPVWLGNSKRLMTAVMTENPEGFVIVNIESGAVETVELGLFSSISSVSWSN